MEKEQISAVMSLLAKNRWKNKSKAERQAHSQKMNEIKRQKKLSTSEYS